MAPKFLVYTMPACPHCDRAKGYLDMKSVPYTAVLKATQEERMALVEKTGWRSFPQIFELDAEGRPSRFIGGADALQQALFGG